MSRSEDKRDARGLRLAVCLQLHDANVCNHVRALARHPAVGQVRVVRSALVPALTERKVVFDVVAAAPKWKRFLELYRRCRALVREQAVDAVLSFNPFPYGWIAAAATRGEVPYHLGFIGTELFGARQAAVGALLRRVLRRAAFVTVTGARMREECRRMGVPSEALAVLPHTIDLDRFSPGDASGREYAFIFMGNLIPLKRVDLIVRALAAVRGRHPAARLCVVGDGPARGDLMRLAESLGLAGAVDFVGYVDDVVPWLRRASVLVMASESEGMPFAIIEALCCGVVPVSTRVGTIDEELTDEETGLLVPPGDATALAAALGRLLDDPVLYGRLRAGGLERRAAFGDARAMAAWDPWLRQLARGGEALGASARSGKL